MINSDNAFCIEASYIYMDDTRISLISLCLSIGVYAVWYWFQFHQFCSAMWFGTAPILIIGIAFISIRKFLLQLAGMGHHSDRDH